MALPDLTDLFVADCYHGYLHTANTPLTGNEYVQVYDGLGNPSSLQLGLSGIKVGNNVFSTIQGKDKQFLKSDGQKSVFEYIFPVGAIYLSVTDVNPSSYFGGTWKRIAKGKFLAGEGEGIDKNGNGFTVSPGDDTSVGEYTHKLTSSEIPEHTHNVVGMTRTGNKLDQDPSKVVSWISDFASENVDYAMFQANDADGGRSSSVGEDKYHNNISPFFGVYAWQRTE